MLPQLQTIRASVLTTLLGAVAAFAEAPPPAASLLSEAQTQAAHGQRGIFATFHASW